MADSDRRARLATMTGLAGLLTLSTPAAAQWGYPWRSAPLHPAEIVDILIEDYGFQAVRRPRFTGPIYVAEGVDRRGATVRVFIDSRSGEVVEREVLAHAPDRRPSPDRRMASAGPFADDGVAPGHPPPPRRPPELIRPRASAAPPPEPPTRAAGPAAPSSRPRFADPRPLGEPDQPPPFARGDAPRQP
jgi:hypothetical protein